MLLLNSLEYLGFSRVEGFLKYFVGLDGGGMVFGIFVGLLLVNQPMIWLFRSLKNFFGKTKR